MLTPKYPKPITKPTPKRVSPEEKASKSCTKTCAPGSQLDLRACKCVQKAVGPRDTTFNSETGRFDPNPQAIGPKPMDTPPPMKKGGTVVKGSQLRRQASSKGLRTSKKHK